MTAPANKRRTHNDDARAAAQRTAPEPGERVPVTRASRYGQRLKALRDRRRA